MPAVGSDTEPCRVAVFPERDIVRVRPVGELDLATVDEVQAQLRELRDAGFRRFLLDLRDLTFMDLTGLRLILTLDAVARQDGINFGLISGPPEVQRVFQLCGVLDRLSFANR